MTVSELDRAASQNLKDINRRTLLPPLATLVMLTVVLVTGAICAAWFAGEGTIYRIFSQLDLLQKSPPLWLEVPMVTGAYLLLPAVLLLAIALLIMRVSPEPQAWSRSIVIGILLVLTVRYLLWRALTTLNLSTPLNGVFSLGLFFLEMLMLLSGTIQLFLMLRVRDRRREADLRAVAVLQGKYLPTVDILIPTYNEGEAILRRTVIGCQAIEYPHHQVYLLDDTRRPEIRALAEELGCHYLTRPDQAHAKAGNLNHAIAQTRGELIVVFDADFVPTRNFLRRTVGFFQEEQVALVQTPQSFYNPDPIARNLGLENILTSEEEVFYRQIQPIRDGAGSVICSGTSFVVRRRALEAAGGFVTDSLSEDYFTGVRLSAQGYQLLYLDEKLSAGLAAENMAAYAIQRLRWARGTLQAFFIEANPLTIRGLSPIQRLAHLEGLLHWFTSLSRVGYLLIPLAYSFLAVIPIRATAAELMYFFLPYYVVQLAVFAWLSHHSRSAIISDIYSLVLAFPLALTVIQVMLNPFSKGFHVTPKGTVSDRYSFNWNLALPLIGLFLASAVSLWRNLGICMIKGAWMAEVPPEVAQQMKGIGLGWLWSAYNLVMVGIALLILLDVPQRDWYNWFDLRRTVRLRCFIREPEGLAEWEGNRDALSTFWGSTTMISEAGTEIALTQGGFPTLQPGESLPVTLDILEENLKLQGMAVSTGNCGEFPTVRVMFEAVSLAQQRQLIEMLFCRPGQWKRRRTPNEWQSLLLLLRVLLRPRVLFERKRDVRAIAVAKG